MTRLIRAAGGVVFRKTPKGKVRVLVVHRPQYDDWTPPKGKADKGESPEETAIREVLEETGYRCRIVAPLGPTRYRVQGGVKEVHWFGMRPLPDSPGFTKNSEVDQVKWLSPRKLADKLSYDQDRELIAGTDFKKLAQTGNLYLFRHTTAGERSRWKGRDEDRSLTKKGWREADAIAGYLADAGIERIFSSPYERCVQSVKPLAKLIKAPVEISPLLGEEPDIDAAYALDRRPGGHQRRGLLSRRRHTRPDQPHDVGRAHSRFPVLLLQGLHLGRGDRRREIHQRLLPAASGGLIRSIGCHGSRPAGSRFTPCRRGP